MQFNLNTQTNKLAALSRKYPKDVTIPLNSGRAIKTSLLPVNRRSAMIPPPKDLNLLDWINWAIGEGFISVGGGGSSYTFQNGLTNTSGTVELGGVLTKNTTIDATSRNFIVNNGNLIGFNRASGGAMNLTSVVSALQGPTNTGISINNSTGIVSLATPESLSSDVTNQLLVATSSGGAVEYSSKLFDPDAEGTYLTIIPQDIDNSNTVAYTFVDGSREIVGNTLTEFATGTLTITLDDTTTSTFALTISLDNTSKTYSASNPHVSLVLWNSATTEHVQNITIKETSATSVQFLFTQAGSASEVFNYNYRIMLNANA